MAGVSPTAIVALDVPDAGRAEALIDAIGDRCRFYKVGSELFTAEGPAVVGLVRARRCEVFLDLKLHDIPNTVRAAVQRAAALGVSLLTVHASGGRRMMEAAIEGGGKTCGILAVTVLTSLTEAELAHAWGHSTGALDIGREVLRLASVAADAGTYGVVCGGTEAAGVRERHGRDLRVLVPGVRFGEGAGDDQRRVVTPAAAVAAGADYIVLGRAVTAAPDPAAAMDQVLAALR